MKEYNDFKNLSFPVEIITRDGGSAWSSGYVERVKPQTGSTVRGAVLPINVGVESVKFNTGTGTITEELGTVDAYKLEHYGKGMLIPDGSNRIKTGTYITLSGVFPNQGGLANEDLQVFKDNTNTELVFPPEGKSVKAFTSPDLAGKQPLFSVVNVLQDFVPSLGQTTLNGLVFDGRRTPDYLTDFDKLKYTIGSEQQKQDSFLATTSYSAAEVKPVMHKNINEYLSDPKWNVSNNLTFFEGNTNTTPNSQGVYFYMAWCKTRGTSTATKSFFQYGTTSITIRNGTGMAFFDKDIQLVGFETFGPINTAGIYLKRIADFPKYSDATNKQDINNLEYSPYKRPNPTNVIQSVKYVEPRLLFPPPQGGSFTWQIISNNSPFSVNSQFSSFSWTGGGGIPSYPEWTDGGIPTTPVLAFFTLMECEQTVGINETPSRFTCNVTITFTNGGTYQDYLNINHKWCMIPLNGKEIDSIEVSLVDPDGWDINDSIAQLVYLN